MNDALRREPDARMPTAPAVRKRALVVDDSERVRSLLERHLAAKGWAVTACPDGRSGCSAALTTDFDLILTDLSMPGMDGLSLIREVLRTKPASRVIVVTAASDNASTERALRYGAVDFLRKPFVLDDLDRAVERTMSRSVGASATRPVDSLGASALLNGNEIQTLIQGLASEPSPEDAAALKDRMHWAGTLATAAAREAGLSGSAARRLRCASRLRALDPASLRALEELGLAASLALRRGDANVRADREASPRDSAQLGALVEAIDFLADRWSSHADAPGAGPDAVLCEGDRLDPDAARIVAIAARRISLDAQY